MNRVESVRWSPDGNGVRIVDQRLLPGEYREVDLRDAESIVAAIRSLAVRGAPAIGITAALGLAHLALGVVHLSRAQLTSRIAGWGEQLKGARPTAVNLAWAVDRVLNAAARELDTSAAVAAMALAANTIKADDELMCRKIGEHGADLLQDGMNILTHCNTGALATGGIGTALAAIYVAHERGIALHVFASETRPLLQGSRLTAWELARVGIPVTVVGEGAVASLLRAGRVDCAIVGADRITRNGDVANKIGTYSHAVSAAAHGAPFYVAAPSSTIDGATPSGADVVIEQREPDELLGIAGHPITQVGIAAYNPAFDVTPASYVSAIITEAGVHRRPYDFLPSAEPI